MQHYMVEFVLPELSVDVFRERLNEQQKEIELLMAKGIIKNYSFAKDYSKLWLIANADSEFGIMKIISKLPMNDFMIPSIMPLMFSKTSSQVVREYALN